MEIKVFDQNEYIYSFVDVDDKFIIVANLYHSAKYKIIVTDFKEYKKSIELDDWDNIIAVNSIRFLQKLDGNRVFINSMSEATINFLKSENINVVAPPEMFRLYLQRRIDQKKLRPEDNHLREYLIQTLWAYHAYFVSFQLKWQCKQMSPNTSVGNDQLKIVLHSYTGETVKEVLIQDSTESEDTGIPYLHNYVCCENIFVGILNDRLFVIDIDSGRITKYLLKNREYSIEDINSSGEIILRSKRNLIILKSTDNGIDTILNTEYKGFINAARFNHADDLVIFSSRKIRSFRKDDLQPLRDLDVHKIYINKTLVMNDGRMLLYYSAYNKHLQEYRAKIKVIEI
jgi:hypothetical protein